MPYVDNVPHAGSAEVLVTGMFDEPAGTIARTMPRFLVGTNNLAAFSTGGQVAGRIIPLAAGMVISNIAICFGGTGATGPTHLWFGLADAQLNVLAVTADQGAAAQGASTFTKLALASSYLVPYTGVYTVLASSSSSTTAPTLCGVGLATGNIAVPAPLMCGFAGNQVTPPAIGAQLNSGALTGNGNGNFAAWLS